ncbi:TIGR03013 family XrtA/PEP-CTERM system glycosyltransferase [Pyrinomonas methylaliphatogenes]|uniref:Sugar transferase, PEP-CTERM system associated/exopolysaccharide biosynthesis polyprenyl glycosylphosphotransferase n=1 Tax=Pyrinomonas methylaliphatogenes TaxID=454194 RepID=A0A0B6WX94_9BACT|nr:TIGR03013 family XrtA/PEP-CTERM system glycosyltransferase [Pyrinomonas methylaliphatogenes]MBX5478250.1 TIGR03013 family PEP-CTERM/XrtA system glycosyltransferase [Pyrinomonas methylaliphatogenes]CDM65908.1 sugar transferase, PEP-CTERM system associated/exopolysaccharide biosynthesis polyprenyl glycosylphosphotransferase [Pyrinomonas methylaliphatogenes]
MKSGRHRARTLLLLFAEAMLLFGGMMLATLLRLGSDGFEEYFVEHYGVYKAALVTIVCLAAFYFYDLYDFVVIGDRRELVLRLMQALGMAWVALAVIFYVAPDLMVGRGVSLIALPLALGLMVGWRVSIHYLLGHPKMGERILIVGTGAQGLEIAREVLARRDAGYRIVGFVDNKPELVGRSLINPRVLGTTTDLPELVRREGIDRIVVAMGERRGRFPTKQLLDLSLSGDVAIEEGTSFYERLTGRVHLDMLRPSWLIFTGRGRQARLSAFLRALLHRGAALVGGLLSLPIVILTAIAIKLDSPGPIFYRQERVGKNGRIFTLIKFRSMRVDAEKEGPVWAKENDDRTTRVGRIIRKTRIDEIPQFWNILKGEMNFVGPRPERPHFVKQLAEEIPFYEQRHLVAPGLTGWAQIKYPYGASIEDARQKLQYDLYYIKNQSLALDALIMFETIKIILFGRGAR